MTYTHSEIIRYFSQIDCVPDIQRIADYLADNREKYTLDELNEFGDLLKAYIEVYD